MADAAPNLESVYQGIHTLYNDPHPSEKEKAGKWLEEVQKSASISCPSIPCEHPHLISHFSQLLSLRPQVYSWKIADEILQEKRDIESCSFAALTMRNKIQSSFHELPAESHESLRDALLIHISQITPQTNKVIVRHLCLALTDLALLMASWKSPVLDLIEKFSGRPDLLAALLEILRFLPEEVNSRYLRLGANRREEIVKQLEGNSNTVHEFLCQCVTNALTAQQAISSNSDTPDRASLPYDPEHIQTMAIKCFTSWVSVSAIQITDIADNVIVSQVFTRLSRDPFQESTEVHDIAADCLTILLQWVEMCPGNQLLEMQLFTCVMELEKAFQAACTYEHMDATMNYCRIFTHTAEAFLERITSKDQDTAQPHYALKTFDLILKCIACYDYEVARITFNLWYRLSEELYEKDCAALTNQFKPYIELLITELTRHSQMDPDHEGLIDEQEELFVSVAASLLTLCRC